MYAALDLHQKTIQAVLKDGRWLICYMDDAARFIVGYGVFKEATSKHAVEVLHHAIGNYGKPAAILSDRGHTILC